MNPRVLGTAVVVAVFALGARDTGCIGYQEERAPQACPAIGCANSCPNGQVMGDDGCPTCECQPTESSTCATDADCNADEACVQVVCVTTPCEPRCEKKPTTNTSACMVDSDCAAGELCDVKNFCDAPPGCDPKTTGCPPVCYGRCVTGGTPSECDGVIIDALGACLKPDGTKAAPECCKAPPPPTKCGDGSATACDALPPTCEAPYVAGPWQGCWACFDPNTCNRECTTDSECGRGFTCQPDPSDPCNGPAVDCFRAGRMYCAPEACDGVICDMYCEHGFDTDPATGCAICKCREEPTCNCTKEYKPVCGTDGNTYGNECEANCAGVKAASAGECAQCTVTCNTPTPVCGEDGVTYNCGEPDALCHNTRVAHNGECGTNCNIQCFVADPVCGSDGVTYGCGEVDAKCHGASVVHAGECGKICKADSECGKDETCFISAVARKMYGECQPSGYCEVPEDCLRYPQPVIACVGKWTCPKNQCQYLCGP